MKGLETKILSKWILNPWIFLNNKQTTLSIWTSIINFELFGRALHQSCTHDPRINGSPVSPLRALAEGSMSLPLSLWMWSQWYANSYCGFQGPCCVSAMIWSGIVFLLTLSLLPSITNVEPQRDYEHCHDILHLTSPSDARDFTPIFTLLNWKKKKN